MFYDDHGDDEHDVLVKENKILVHHDNGDFREEDLRDDQGHGDDNDVVDDADRKS